MPKRSGTITYSGPGPTDVRLASKGRAASPARADAGRFRRSLASSNFSISVQPARASSSRIVRSHTGSRNLAVAERRILNSQSSAGFSILSWDIASTVLCCSPISAATDAATGTAQIFWSWGHAGRQYGKLALRLLHPRQTSQYFQHRLPHSKRQAHYSIKGAAPELACPAMTLLLSSPGARRFKRPTANFGCCPILLNAAASAKHLGRRSGVIALWDYGSRA
jgi:hypothetical protein